MIFTTNILDFFNVIVGWLCIIIISGVEQVPEQTFRLGYI
jgi:hypothetical protein